MKLKFMSTLDCLYSFNLCLMGLGCPLLRGSSDRRLPRCAVTLSLFWKGHSQAQSSLQFSGRWRWRCRAWRKKIYPSGFITWVESIVVSRRVRHLPAVEGAYVHWRRRHWGWFWRLRWLRTIIVTVCISSIVRYRHCRQDIERIGRQVQVVQAWGNNWELPSKTIRYRWLVRVVVNCKNIGLRGCNRRDWWHSLVAWCSDRSVEFITSGELFLRGLSSFDICST